MDMYIYGKLGKLIMTKEGINVLITNLTGKVHSHFATFGLYSF